MASTTLISALSNIADAIRAKGVTGTMNALEMPAKVGSLVTNKYGVVLDGWVGNINAQGQLGGATTNFEFSSPDILSIGNWTLQNTFYSKRKLTKVSLPNLTSCGVGSLFGAFRGCVYLTSVEMPSLETSGDNAFQGMCYEDERLVFVDLSSLTTTGTNGLDSAFRDCTSLKTVLLKKLSQTGSNWTFSNTFNGCTALELVDFSEATAVPALSSTSAFANTNNTYTILVPDALYSTWIASTNWSDPSIVGHIVKVSDYTPPAAS